ncbi:MAG TPA: hypothetical protein VMF30_10935 [Pirellulales bacterium]|nr:hypothetical protein [Pirellulales bacterium]
MATAAAMTTMVVTEPAVATTASRSATAFGGTAAITRAARAAMATMTGHSRFLTADQGDADDREEDRDAKDKHTIHPKILQVTGSGT